MRVKDGYVNMLVDGKAVRHRWAEYFDELLNVHDGVHASFYVDSKACVRIGNEFNELFSVNIGVHQGCVTSP